MRTPRPSPRAAIPDAERRQVLTFAEACETVISIHAGGWKHGGKNEQNWRSTMRDYVFPRLGDMPVDAVAGNDYWTQFQRGGSLL